MRVIVDKVSYYPGEVLEIRLVAEGTLRDGENIANVSIDILRVDVDRNRTTFGFGTTPIAQDGAWLMRQTLPAEMKPGLHCITHIAVSSGQDVESGQATYNAIEPAFFVIQRAVELPASHSRLMDYIAEAERARGAYIRTSLRTQKVVAGAPALSFRVILFATGCLLGGPQQMAGYKLVPLGQGLSHRRLLEVVNCGLAGEGIEGLPYIEQTEQLFATNTPTFMLDYTMVSAVDHLDAFLHCNEHAALVYRALCLERGSMPEGFASFALQYESAMRWHEFRPPWYQGNLLQGFDVATTADAVDRMLPKLQTMPFVRLLVSTFSDGLREADHGFKLLRFWSVLELVADQAIPLSTTGIHHPDGTPILKANGKPVTLGEKVARVYAYILASGAYQHSGSYHDQGLERRFIVGGDPSHPSYAPGIELITLWDVVRATYAIRNAIAHTGQFDDSANYLPGSNEALAKRFKKITALDPMHFAKLQAEMAIRRAAG